jgi:hypothetical protein
MIIASTMRGKNLGCIEPVFGHAGVAAIEGNQQVAMKRDESLSARDILAGLAAGVEGICAG